MRLEGIILFLGICSPFTGSVIFSQEVADPSVLEENLLASEVTRKEASYRLDTFVNWDYKRRSKLKGWQNTATLIRYTLTEWGSGSVEGKTAENGAPTELQKFLSKLDPPEASGAVHLVYLASHQSPAGEWEFTNRQKIALEHLLPEVKLSLNPHRIIIMDTCYAEAVPDEWRRQLGSRGFSLFACSARELTLELNVNRRQPVWFKKRYPLEIAWLENRFGKKWMSRDSRLSFLGFVWLRAYLKTKTPPRTTADWERFLRSCEAEAAAFRQESSQRLSSTIRMVAPGG